MERYELLIRFFREIGAAREAEMYLRLFHKGEPHRFAVIEVAEDLTGFSLHLLALNLAFLSSLDLYPIVLHGVGGSRGDGEGESESPLPEPGMWKWLTGRESAERPAATKAEWQGARDATLALNETLASTVNIQDGDASGLISGVFSGDPAAGAPGSAISVRVDKIRKIIRGDGIPIVAALTMPDRSSTLRSLSPLPIRAACRALVARLQPRKVIRVTEAGGLKRPDGSIIDYINLKAEAERLLSEEPSGEPPLDGTARADLAYYRELLETLPHRSVVEITGASSLLRELFTQKGGGTLIKHGRALRVHESLSGLSRRRIRMLIERSFGKRLQRDYFNNRFHRACPILTVIVDPDYKGVAIVRSMEGLAYLDKFAVRPDARGEGIAVDLWTILAERHPEFFWRSRPENPINAWYFEKADGMMKFPEWFVWWKGLSTRDAHRAVKLALDVEPALS